MQACHIAPYCAIWRHMVGKELRAFRFLETTDPALENNLSEGVDVAGILSHDLASLASRGKRCSLTFHHS